MRLHFMEQLINNHKNLQLLSMIKTFGEGQRKELKLILLPDLIYPLLILNNLIHEVAIF